jgi:hypothetical protein
MNKQDEAKLIKILDMVDACANEKDVYIDYDMVIKHIVDKNIWAPTAEDIEMLIFNYADGTKNRCTICNVDMGKCNPRQLCGKSKCLEE